MLVLTTVSLKYRLPVKSISEELNDWAWQRKYVKKQCFVQNTGKETDKISPFTKIRPTDSDCQGAKLFLGKDEIRTGLSHAYIQS